MCPPNKPTSGLPAGSNLSLITIGSSPTFSARRLAMYLRRITKLNPSVKSGFAISSPLRLLLVAHAELLPVRGLHPHVVIERRLADGLRLQLLLAVKHRSGLPARASLSRFGRGRRLGRLRRPVQGATLSHFANEGPRWQNKPACYYTSISRKAETRNMKVIVLLCLEGHSCERQEDLVSSR